MGVSPVSFLEIQFLAEIGRVGVRIPESTEALMADSRFIVDELPLCTVDRAILEHHVFVADEAR